MSEFSGYINLVVKRKEIGLTQKDVAEQLSVSVSAVKAWEHFDGNITKDNLIAYSELLHIDPMEVIDPSHHFKHVNDVRGVNLEDTGSVNDIKEVCTHLSPKRLKKVYSVARRELKEQNSTAVTYDNIRKEQESLNLRIDGEINGTDDISFYNSSDVYSLSFNGNIPDNYSKCLLINTSSLGCTFSKGQKVFLNKATSSNLYSGVLVIAEKDGKLYLRIHRSTNHNLYMIPIISGNNLHDSDIAKQVRKYRWHKDDGWKILYTINQFHY